MNKRNFYVLAMNTVFLSSITSANPDMLYHSGFYAGASLGYSYMNAKVGDKIIMPGVMNASGSSSPTNNGYVGDINIGYRHFFQNKYMLGFEFGLGRDNNQIEKEFLLNNNGFSFANTTKLKSSYKFTPALVIGKQFTERWLGFAKLGVGFRRFRGSHTVDSGFPPTDTESFHTTKAGADITVGSEYAFNKKLSGIATVSYERYGKINKTYRNFQVAPPLAGENHPGILKPSYVTFKLGAIYKF